MKTRQEIEAINPRAGWIARNLDAEHGRVYDYMGGKGYMVEWDWADHYVQGYDSDGKRIVGRDGGWHAVEACMAHVEAAAHA